MRLLMEHLHIGIILLLYITIALTSEPKFDPTTRMRLVLIPADAAVGSVIYRLRASDEEFDYPLNFELMGDASSSTVQIDSLKCTKYNSICQANVVLIQRLEAGRYYDFKVSVKDTRGGIATQSCSVTATNFTTPHDLIFPHKPSIIMLPEDAKRGTVLDYVIARKNPLGSKDVILELHGSPLFAIRQKIVSPQATEGTIILLGSLDFEAQHMYHLVVLANDAYAEPGQDSRNIAGFEIVIIVQDVQDVPPVFTNASPVTRLPASVMPGDKILQVHAEDGDKGNPREIRYGFVSEGNPFTTFFNINDTTGEIFLLKPIEEISAITHFEDPILLTIIAEEVKFTRNEPPSMATTVQIALFLPEKINSPPYFENDQYIARIDENAAQGTALVFTDPYLPRVHDDDAGKNGVFSLALLGNNGTFEISPNVAERHANFIIYVRNNFLLDYEARHTVQFRVLAQELSPTSNLSKSVHVVAYLNDVNDNPPIFTEETYIADIPENITAGIRVIQVHAEDVDTGAGGHIRYNQIIGYLNTSLTLNPENGLIVISTNNHGFDREMMPEYHMYVEARDNDGSGNSAQVPFILKIIDINDNAPLFEKPVYEFILLSNLKNFTVPAFVRATDADAEEPNNIVRYEIMSGNYDNLFRIDKYTGQLMLTSSLTMNRNDPQTHGILTLTVRGYDLGVPVLFSTVNVRIYPPESKTRSITFLLPGHDIDRSKTENFLSTITGGRVIIHDVQPYDGDVYDGSNDKTLIKKDTSLVTATVLYDSNSVVDILQIQKRLHQNYSTSGIFIKDDANMQNLHPAESKILFWLLVFFALLIILSILMLLLCCTCSWCPLYNLIRKGQIRDRSIKDDDHLVRTEFDVGKHSKSVQVAEWMGRREAWSAEKSSDSRTKSTQWEFRKRNIDSNLGSKTLHMPNDKSTVMKFNTDVNDVSRGQEISVQDNESNFLDKRSTAMNILEEKFKQTDNLTNSDVMQSNEVNKGSDATYDYHQSASKMDAARYGEQLTHREQYFIKEGNAEILRLITRGKNDEENIFVNIPPQQSQYIMLENGDKEILMRRFIDEQVNGKQIVREHYQFVPTIIQPKQQNIMPNDQRLSDVQVIKHTTATANHLHDDQNAQYSAAYKNVAEIASHSSLIEPQMSNINHSQSILEQELEMSLKEQNTLLRQILLEKERLQEKYIQQGIVLETQSLPGHSTAIATQTDCEAGTQTDFKQTTRRRARSENDSMSEDDYTYVHYSPPDGEQNVFRMKRGKHRRRKPNKRVILVEEVKRKIRTPIAEESEYIANLPPHRRYFETKTSILRRIKNGSISERNPDSSKEIKNDAYTEISDSIDQHRDYLNKQTKKLAKYENNFDNEIENDADFFGNSDSEIVIRRNNYSEDSIEDTDSEKIMYYRKGKAKPNSKDLIFSRPLKKMNHNDNKIYLRDQNSKSKSAINIPKRDTDKQESYRRVTASESSNATIGRKISKKIANNRIAKNMVAQSEADLINRLCDDEFEVCKPVPVPRYMQWYYNMNKESDSVKRKCYDHSMEKERNLTNNRKFGNASEKLNRSKKTASNEPHSVTDSSAKKTTPSKGARLLKEDFKLNQTFSKKSQEPNHPLLQYSEHRYEHEYIPAPEIAIPPTKLPHYMYPETPPLASIESCRRSTQNDDKNKSKIPLISENESIEQSSHHSSQTEINSNQIQSKQLDASTLEDDHDSGIAMNPLLHTLGKRNRITEKKSVFTIAYDELNLPMV